MHILVAPDCFTGTLTAAQAAEAMATGWSRGAPADTTTLLPLADGGPGFLEVVRAGRGGELLSVTVPGPFGGEVPAAVLLVDDGGVRSAYVESAQAVGLHLVPEPDRDPTRTTTSGVGVLLRAALDAGARRVVVGLGGSATNDAGAGMLAALGGGAPALAAGGGTLDLASDADLEGLSDLRRALEDVDLVAAYDVDVPLLGLHGASAGFSPQKGATPEQAQDLERALGHFAQVVGRVVATDGVRRDLLATDAAGTARRLAGLPGAGAAGGLGFGLAALGGRLVPGARVVAEAVDLAGAVARADLVLTGEGTLDWHSLHGKVVHHVAQEGLRHAVPVVAVAGQVFAGRREWAAAGLAGVYAVAERPRDVPVALDDAAGTLADRVARVARTWSPTT